MRKLIPALVLLSLAGCTGAENRLIRTAEYHALGHDPAWVLTMKGRRLTFLASDPKTRIELPAPSPVLVTGVRSYAAGRVNVAASARPCNDSRSGVAFAETVVVVANGLSYEGCGGERLPQLDRDPAATRTGN